MPNEQNLMPIAEVNSRRTREQHSEDSRRAGIASGVSRRRKKSLREAAELYLSLPVSDKRAWNKLARDGVSPEDVDNQMAVIAGLTIKAAKGDAKAAKLLFDLLGEQSKEEPKSDRQALADLLLHPVENRDIKDFEE